jgi:isopenicillin-N epimerase
MTNPLWGEDWPAVRAAWSLDPDVSHLNHGSFGAVPIEVQAAQAALRTEAERNPNAFYSRALTGRLDAARRTVALFLGADPEGVAFVPNPTTGLAVALTAVPLRPGDEVVVTDHAYPAALHAAEQACLRSGATLVLATLGLPDPEASASEATDTWRTRLAAAVTDRTAVAVIDRIAAPLGILMPAAAMVADLSERGVTTIVDAAHAPGTLDEGPGDIGADLWVGSFHKWPCAPRGSAALVVAPARRSHVEPLAPSSEPPSGFPDNLAWWGTDDYSAWLCVPAALAFLDALGWDRLRRHNRTLVRHGAAVVGSALGVSVPVADDLVAFMAPLPLPAGSAIDRPGARALAERIAIELHAEVVVSAWGGQGWLRLSAHAYNHPGEYEALAAGLPALLAR